MPYTAKILEVMIASPSDVAVERQIVRDVLADWNDLHAKERALVFLPVAWESHSTPDLSGRPQQLINDRMLAGSDILVGMFWTRIGSPTGKSVSGTVEEIHEHRRAGKPVMLYFSKAAIPQDKLNFEQMAEIEKLKEWAFKEGIVGEYATTDEFRTLLGKDLHKILRDNDYLKSHVEVDFVAVFNETLKAPTPSVMAETAELLRSAAADERRPLIMLHTFINGTRIQAGQTDYGRNASPRDLARWRAAIAEAHSLGLTRDMNGKGEMFELTDAGFKFVDSTS